MALAHGRQHRGHERALAREHDRRAGSDGVTARREQLGQVERQRVLGREVAEAAAWAREVSGASSGSPAAWSPERNSDQAQLLRELERAASVSSAGIPRLVNWATIGCSMPAG